jgi:hypothetical protein
VEVGSLRALDHPSVRCDIVKGELVRVLLCAPVVPRELPQMVVEFVEHHERVVEILLARREYLLSV